MTRALDDAVANLPFFLFRTVAGAVTIMACESRLSDLGDGNATTDSVSSKKNS